MQNAQGGIFGAVLVMFCVQSIGGGGGAGGEGSVYVFYRSVEELLYITHSIEMLQATRRLRNSSGTLEKGLVRLSTYLYPINKEFAFETKYYIIFLLSIKPSS